jgi:hypothetical protein
VGGAVLAFAPFVLPVGPFGVGVVFPAPDDPFAFPLARCELVLFWGPLRCGAPALLPCTLGIVFVELLEAAAPRLLPFT